MASSLGSVLKATIEVATKGADKARSELRAIADDVERLGTSRASAAGYADQARALRNVATAAQGVGNAFSLTRQEALTLNFTIGDIVASLASGASPLTILLQQGGQVRDGFGSLSNLLNKVAAQFVRFVPQITAIGAAIAAISFTKLGASAAEAAEEIGRLSERAGVSLEQFQKFQAAAAAKGVPADSLAQGLNSLTGAALKSAQAAQEFETQWGAARRTGSQVVTDQKLIAESLKRTGAGLDATGDLFVDLGINMRKFNGSAEESTALVYQIADAVASLGEGRKAQQILRELEGIVGRDGVRFFKLGSDGIRKYSAEVDKFAAALTTKQVEQGKKYQESVRLYEEGNKRLKESIGAIFIPAAQAGQDFFNKLLVEKADAASRLRTTLVSTGQALRDFFRVLSGAQENFSSPFLAGFLNGLRTVRDVVTRLTGAIPDLFNTIAAAASDGLAKVDEALGGIGGGIGDAFRGIREAANTALTALKGAFSGLTLDSAFAGTVLGIATAVKALQIAAKVAIPVLLAFSGAIIRATVGLTLGPLTALAGVIVQIGSVARAALVNLALFALSLGQLSAAATATVFGAVATGIANIGSAASLAKAGIGALANALAGLTLRVVFSPAVLGVAAIYLAIKAIELLAANWDRLAVSVELAASYIQTRFFLPLQIGALKATAIILGIAGAFDSVGASLSIFIDLWKAMTGAVGEALAGITKKFFGDFDAGNLLGPLGILIDAIKGAFNSLWSGVGDLFEKYVVNKVKDTQWFKDASAKFKASAQGTWDKALSLEKGRDEAEKNLDAVRAKWEELAKLSGTLSEDQAKRVSATYKQITDAVNSTFGTTFDPNNLGASALAEINRLLGRTSSEARTAADAVKKIGDSGEEAAGKVQSIGIIKGGVRSSIPIVTREVQDLEKAVDGVSRKQVTVTVGKGGALGTTTVQVEQLGDAADKAASKFDNLSKKASSVDQVEVPQSYLVDQIEEPAKRAVDATQKVVDKNKELGQVKAAPIDETNIARANAGLDEAKRKKDALNATPVAATPTTAPQAAPQPQATPVDAARTAIEALRQLIAQALQEAQNFAAGSVILVSNSIQQLTNPATEAINSLNGALSRAIENVNRLAGAVAALPALPNYNGSNQGGDATVRAASGGLIQGPGTGTSDSILARLSSGEFVVRAAAVRRYGVDFMRRLNGMALSSAKVNLAMPRFAMGGLVQGPSAAGTQSPGRPVTLVLDGKSFGPFTAGGDVVGAVEKHVSMRKLSRTTARVPSRIG